MPHHELQLQLCLKSGDIDETGSFEGYGSVFGNIDQHQDIVVEGAYTQSLNTWRAKGKWPPLLWFHQSSEPIGVFKDIQETSKGLYIKSQLLIDDDFQAKRAYAHMKAGNLDGLSVGLCITESRYDNTGIRYIEAAELIEISLVGNPANEQARVASLKQNNQHRAALNALTSITHALREQNKEG